MIATRGKDIEWNGKTPLQYAVELGKLDVVNALIEKGADVGMPLADGQNVLVHSIIPPQATTEIVKALYAQIGPADPTSVLDGFLDHAAQLASTSVVSQSTGSVETLLALGFDPNTSVGSGPTPLDTAVTHGNIDVIKGLLSDKSANPVLEATRLKALVNAVQSKNFKDRAAAMVEQLLTEGEKTYQPSESAFAEAQKVLTAAINAAESSVVPNLLLINAKFSPGQDSWNALRKRLAATKGADTTARQALLAIQDDMITAVMTANPGATIADINQKLSDQKATVVLEDFNVELAKDFGKRPDADGLRNLDGSLTDKGKRALDAANIKRVIQFQGDGGNTVNSFYYLSNPVTAEEEARRSIIEPATNIIERFSKVYATLPADTDWENKLRGALEAALTVEERKKYSVSVSTRESVQFQQDWATTSTKAGEFYKNVKFTVNLGLKEQLVGREKKTPTFPYGTTNRAVDLFKLKMGKAASESRPVSDKLTSGLTQANLETLYTPSKSDRSPIRFNYHVNTVRKADASKLSEFPSLMDRLPLVKSKEQSQFLQVEGLETSSICVQKRDVDFASRALDPVRIGTVLRKSSSQVISLPLRRDLCDQDIDSCAHAIFDKLRSYASSATVRYSAFIWQKIAAALEESSEARSNLFRAIMNDAQRAFYYEGNNAKVSGPLLMMPTLTDVMRVY